MVPYYVTDLDGGFENLGNCYPNNCIVILEIHKVCAIEAVSKVEGKLWSLGTNSSKK